MNSEWRVTANPIGSGMMYAVYRLKDTGSTDHSGNREYATDYMDDQTEATKIAAELNSGKRKWT